MKGFKFQLDVCTRFHDLRMMSINPNDIAILNICSVIIVILLMELASKRKDINFLKNSDLSEDSGIL